MSANMTHGYAGTKGAAEYDSPDGSHFVLIFNDIGSAITNGDVYRLDTADSSGGNYPTLVLPATEATLISRICVVANGILNKTTIAEGEWGYVQTKGYCPVIKCDSSVADEEYLEVLNATSTAIDSGAFNDEAFAQAKSAAASGFCTGHLFGRESVVAAS
jgi:hypothetical protein